MAASSTMPNERTALWLNAKASKMPRTMIMLVVTAALAIFWCFYSWLGHAASGKLRYGSSLTPASLVAERPRCVNTPFDVCDSRVTVSSMGPEQGCLGAPGDETSGRFFVTSFHTGTSNEMAWLSDTLGLNTNIGGFCAHIQASRTNEDNPYVFSNDRVDSIWKDKSLKARLESYAGVISTDTSHAIYPFLRNPAFDHKPLIVWITNRYDITMSDHMPQDSFNSFLSAMQNASCCRKNVYFVAAHPAEIEFARVKYPHMDVSRWRTIYPIGHESRWLHREMMAEHRAGLNLNAEPFKSETLCVYPSANEPGLMKEYRRHFVEANIRFDDSLGKPGPRTYGGPRGMSISCKAILHVPYAPNTMALWENVQMGNIFFLPAPKLVAEWRTSNKISVFQMSHGICLDRPLTEDFLNRTEWYRQDRQPLFVYFSSPEDLIAKFRSLDYAKKRREMRAYMDKHEKEQMTKWKDLFAEVQKSTPSARVLRHPDAP